MKRTPSRPYPASKSRALALGLAAGLALLCSTLAAAQAAAPAAVSGKDRVVFPPAQGSSSFRFLPGGSYAPFDRSLVLSAAPGEQREYQLQVSPGPDAPATVSDIIIDKRRPPAPRAEPGTGLYREGLTIHLSGEQGAQIFWALVGPGGEAPLFFPYAEDRQPSLQPPASGSASYTLLCYEVDAAGNRSYPSRFMYRLTEPGLAAAAPLPDGAAIRADSSLAQPELLPGRGYSELRMKLDAGSSFLVDIQPESPPTTLDDFERVSPVEGRASVRLPCPYGWQGSLSVYFGILRDGIALYNAEALVVSLTNPIEAQPSPALPGDPVLAADGSGRVAFAVFPSYDGQIFVSIEAAEPQLYSSPLALPLDKPSAQVSWYGVDDSGRRSVTRSLALSLPPALPDAELAGIDQGAVVNTDVTLTPASKATIRYELSLDGSPPAEPTISSRLVGDALSVSCPAGEERSVVLRYRAFAGLAAGEGRILRFTIDKKPPEAPRALAPTYSDQAMSLSLLPGLDGKDIFASVSVDGAEAAFAPVTGALEFPGSDSGPVSYLVRAYDVDAAGNRSAEMKSLSFVVDRSTVYASDDAVDRGEGSPDKPFRSLDEALATALRLGKKNLNLRGSFELRAPLRSSAELRLRGGFGLRWAPDPSARVRVSSSLPAGSSLIEQVGGSLSLQRIELSAPQSSPAPLIRLSDAALSLENSSISAGGEGDLLFVSALRSRLSLVGSKLRASRAMACTVLSSEASDIAIESSSILGEAGVRIFGAFDMDGGSLALSQALVEAHSDLGLSLFSLRSASILVDRSLIKVEGGSGYLRLGSFRGVRGEMKNSKVLLSWKGSGTLFDIAQGGPAFRYDTILADSGPDSGSFRFFDVQGAPPELWNCILAAPGRGSELLRSDSTVGQGILVADCLWGFDKLLSGAREILDLPGLNALNADSPLYSSKPIISESPERSFAAPVKSMAPLRSDSACVDAALPLEGGYSIDFSGHPRPGPGHKAPAIGADETTG
jgi:hypothetical protein